MRSLLITLLGLIAPLAYAAELSLPLTRDTLDYWSVSGAKPADFTAEPFTLPPGAQVSRAFTTDAVAVRFETQPPFSSDPENWTVIELGSAALVFARDGDAGFLAVMTGPDAAVLHPRTVPLDEAGRPKAAITATLRRHGSGVALEFEGQAVEFEAASQTEVGVSVSSGLEAPWSFSQFTVLLPVTDEELAIAKSRSSDPEAAAKASGLVAALRSSATSEANAHGGPRAGRSMSEAQVHPADYRPLEIYTPPAVRAKRVEQVKAALEARRNP